MKIYLDKKFLQDISSGEQELLISDEQKEEMERIEGMISQDIRFCSLVTGYRGTGKSSFVHYILKKYMDEKCEKEDEEKKKIVVITYNAAKYKNYETFLRRFVRELYFHMKENNSASEQLGKMYVQTFFDIKTTYRNRHLKSNTNLKEKEKKIVLNNNIDVSFVINFICKMFILLFPIGFAWKSLNKILYKIIFTGIWLGCTYIRTNLEKNLEKKNIEKASTQKSDEQTEVAETFYDEEISEYYIFDELKNINQKDINLIFVLDELDKVKNEELDAIFNDLKPLFLSCKCNFILIAGRNMDKYLFESKKNIDSIAESIFTNRVYVPLSTFQEMMDFAECFFEGKKSEEGKKEFYSNENMQYYFKHKIFKSKGVKRTFINSILSDLKWDNKNYPYIEISENDVSEELKILFDIFCKMEETICQEYTGPKRDELLQNIYYWIEKIKENRYRIFQKIDIVGDEEEIVKKSVYSNVAEQMNLLYAFLDLMVDEKILQKDKEKETFKWKSDIAIKEVKNQDGKEKNIKESDIEYVEMFQKQRDEINNIIYRFSEYNEKIEKGSNIDFSGYRNLLNEMLAKIDESMNLQDKRNLFNIPEVYTNGDEDIAVEDIKKYSRNMSAQRGILVEKLMYFTVEKKLGKGIVKLEEYNNSYYGRFDIIFENNSKIVFFEIKYYKDYTKMIHSSLLLKLRGMIDKYIDSYDIKKYKLKLVVFTNFVDEAGLDKFNDKAKKMLNRLDETAYMDIVLVPFNTFEMFSKQLDEALKIE